MPPFFSDTENAINVQRAFDLKIIEYFADLLFEGDESRILYRNDAYCFRARTDQTGGNLELPFMNMQCVNWEYDDPYNWYTAYDDKVGIYLPTTNKYIHLMPIKMTYNANVWLTRDDDVKRTLMKLLRLKENHSRFQYYLDVVKQTTDPDTGVVSEVVDQIDNIAIFNFTKAEIGTEFSEKDWLEKEEIQNISAGFTVHTFMLTAEECLLYPTESCTLRFSTDLDSLGIDYKTYPGEDAEMRQATYDITVVKGDTWGGAAFTITVNSVNLDLTTALIQMQVRNALGTDVVFERSSEPGGGISITDPTAGKFQIDPVIVDAERGSYLYDIQITIGEVVKTYIKGSFTILNGVTNVG